MITPANDNHVLAELMRTVDEELRKQPIRHTRVPASDIIAIVCEVTGICETDLLGMCRCVEFSSARRVAVVSLRKAKGMSFPEISDKMHYRSHVSSLWAFKAKRTLEEVAAIEEVLHRVGVSVPGGVPMQEEKG